MTTEPVNGGRRVSATSRGGAIPVDAFNPLLRSLISWELVQRVEDADGSHHWVLIEDAQRRLDSLAHGPRQSAAALAYLDHWCASCRQQKLTHLRDGRYLCMECERIEAAPKTTPQPKPAETHHARELMGRLSPRRA
ncbi:MAG: hypothetical protein ACLQK4_17180 [Acidimicrobiales bacterium]|jgi:hypothetical protein